MNKQDEQKEQLKSIGYFSVDQLIQKLQILKMMHGDVLVCGTLGHFQYCEYSEIDGEILIS